MKNNKNNKPGLLIIPSYIGSLKYYEKLLPHISNKYNVSFLFLPNNKDKNANKIMADYCQKDNYNFFQIKDFIPSHRLLSIIPNYYFIKSSLKRKEDFLNIIKKNNIKKIIAQSDYDLFITANKHQIDTLAMQWAATFMDFKAKAQVKDTSLLKMKLISYFNFFNAVLPKIIIYRSFKPLKRKGYADKYGVINLDAKNFYINNRKLKNEKISIIGYLDFIKAEEILSGNTDKSQLLKKYRLNNGKKNITIYSTPFSTKDIKILSTQEHAKYYGKLTQSIRNIFNDEVNIALKIHPSEKKEMYSNLSKKLDVIIIGNDAINEELIYISDLYIAHHSTTNFIPLIYNKDCIFINFIKLKVVDGGKKIFGIKKFITEYDEFEKLLLDYKNGKLEKQYTGSEKIITKNSLKKIIDWID